MKLEDFVGINLLDGVDFLRISKDDDNYYTASVCRFRLNGTTYIATEDPSDGYRSMLGSIKTTNDNPVNIFPPVEVVGVYRYGDTYREKDIIEFVDVYTGKVVLEIGTDNTNDYYPSFVAHFSPENMVVNK